MSMLIYMLYICDKQLSLEDIYMINLYCSKFIYILTVHTIYVKNNIIIYIIQ